MTAKKAKDAAASVPHISSATIRNVSERLRYGKECIDSFEQLYQYMSWGIDADLLLNASSDLFGCDKLSVEEREAFSRLASHGLTHQKILVFIDECDLEKDVIFNRDYWDPLGVQIDEVVEHFAMLYGSEYFDDPAVLKLFTKKQNGELLLSVNAGVFVEALEKMVLASPSHDYIATVKRYMEFYELFDIESKLDDYYRFGDYISAENVEWAVACFVNGGYMVDEDELREYIDNKMSDSKRRKILSEAISNSIAARYKL